jgi:hypothetical protein
MTVVGGGGETPYLWAFLQLGITGQDGAARTTNSAIKQRHPVYCQPLSLERFENEI